MSNKIFRSPLCVKNTTFRINFSVFHSTHPDDNQTVYARVKEGHFHPLQIKIVPSVAIRWYSSSNSYASIMWDFFFFSPMWMLRVDLRWPTGWVWPAESANTTSAFIYRLLFPHVSTCHLISLCIYQCIYI